MKQQELPGSKLLLLQPSSTPGWIAFRMNIFGGWVQEPGWHGIAQRSLRLVMRFCIVPISFVDPKPGRVSSAH
jgi:hypothetical protein